LAERRTHTQTERNERREKKIAGGDRGRDRDLVAVEERWRTSRREA